MIICSLLRVGLFKKLKNWSLTLASLTLLFVSATSNSFAQSSSFDDFQRKVNEGVAEIAKYQQVLQNPDVRVQYQAVQYMLKSNDPALQRIAKEHALFSTNPVMRGSAIKAILDSGQNLRLVVTSTGEKSADVFRWLARVGGTSDGRTGSVIFAVGKPIGNGNCWQHYGERCRFKLAGNSILFQNHGNAGDQAQASMSLGNDGVLRGTIATSRQAGTANVSIDLKE